MALIAAAAEGMYAAGAAVAAPASVPALAAHLGEAAEDMVDTLLAARGDAAAASKLLATMRADVGALRGRVGVGDADVVMLADFLVDETQRQVGRGELTLAALADDQLTLALMRLEPWPSPKARDVALLDYLGREVLLRNRLPLAGGETTLAARRAAIAAAWKRQRTAFAALPAARATVASVDAVVGQLAAGGPPAAQRSAAQKLLDLVDALEKL